MSDTEQQPEKQPQGSSEELVEERPEDKLQAETEPAAGESEATIPEDVGEGDQRAGSDDPADVPEPDDEIARLKSSRAADAEVLAASRRHTRRSFLVAAGGTAAAYGFYRYLDRGPQDDMQPDLLQDGFRANAALSRGIFRDHVLAPTYPVGRAETLRVNGVYGLKMELVPESWRLQLVGMKGAVQHPSYVKDVTAWEYRYTAAASGEDKGHDTKVDPRMGSSAKMAPEPMLAKAAEDENRTGRKPRGMEEAGESDSTLPPGTPGLLLSMEDVVKLPRRELVTQFKCIEGWSQIVHWAGVQMADFIELYPPELIDGKEPRYVYMETPDGDYYTGYDLHVLRHPQTLLVTEMMGAPLTQYHGAPLRLHMPTKYGYKQIKRIALIAYTNEKPDDYWTKLGYDWYAGL